MDVILTILAWTPLVLLGGIIAAIIIVRIVEDPREALLTFAISALLVWAIWGLVYLSYH
jgi:hypothetical protein